MKVKVEHMKGLHLYLVCKYKNHMTNSNSEFIFCWKGDFHFSVVYTLGYDLVNNLEHQKSEIDHKVLMVSLFNVCLTRTFDVPPISLSLSLSLSRFLKKINKYCNQCLQRSFLCACLKFLNISPSTAVAVRDDLKTAKKGRFDTWFICNRLFLPNPSLCLPIKQPRQIDLRNGNSGGQHQWLGY